MKIYIYRVVFSKIEPIRLKKDLLKIIPYFAWAHRKIYPHEYILVISRGGCPRGVMVKAMDYGIVVSEFELHSPYYIHFRTNTLWKGMNPLILPAMC